MLQQVSYIIRARQWPILLLFVLMGGPFLFLFFNSPDDTLSGSFLAGAVVFCLVFYFVNKKHYLFIDNHVLVYKTLLHKKEIQWQDVIKSDISWEIEGMHTASVNWRMIATNNKSLEIRLGFFSRSNMQLLAQHLVERAPNAQFSKKIYQFAEGNFPWYIF